MTQPMQITVAKLYEEIGRLKVENDLLRELNAQLQAHADEAKEKKVK